MSEIEEIERRIEEVDGKIASLVSRGKGGSSAWVVAEFELDRLLTDLSKAKAAEIAKLDQEMGLQ